jgi:hypothetical protein
MHCPQTLRMLEQNAEAARIMAAHDPMNPLAIAKEIDAKVNPPERERDYSEFED